MATQVPPEPANPNTPPANTPDPATPPVDPPAPSSQPTDPYGSRFDRIEQELAESRRINARLAEALDRQNVPVPKVTPPPDVNEFFKDPAGHISRIIDERLEKTIKPLQDFTQQFNVREQYNGMKNAIRAQYGDKFTNVEATVDQLISQNKGPLTPEIVYGAFSMAYGNSQLAPNQPSRPAPSVPNGVVPPNHIPSSPPPVQAPVQQVRQLTETEKVVYEIYRRGRPNATVKDWLDLMEGGVQGASANMTVRDKVVAPNA